MSVAKRANLEFKHLKCKTDVVLNLLLLRKFWSVILWIQHVIKSKFAKW